ncbi:MAG: dockerin type I repeat-containing protein [Bacteroidaceae bacterium]|nr:dockerin type I repeat-containing protein [Bacteroidaceae bacterium]
MKKNSLQLFSAALTFAALFTVHSVHAQTDVTSTYLTNADFEGSYSVYSNPSSDRAIYQPNGWTITYTNGDGNDMTSLNSNCTQWSNFSGLHQPTNGGNNVYWIRFRWGANESLTLSQTVSLPAGTYRFSADAFRAETTGNATLSIAGESISIDSRNTWANYAIVFTLTQTTSVTLAYNFTQGGAAAQSRAGVDNFKLEKFDDATTTEYSWDWTSMIANAGFERGTATSNGGAVNAPYGYTMSTSLAGWINAQIITANPSEGANGYEVWAGQITSVNMHQSLSLPMGKYTITGDMRTDATGNITTQGVYATADGATYKSPTISSVATTWNSLDGWNTLSKTFYVQADGTVVVGVTSSGDGASSKGFFQVDNLTLTYHGAIAKLSHTMTLDAATAVTAGQWYAVDLSSAGDYRITSSGSTTLYYSQSGYESPADVTTNTSINGNKTLTLTAGTLYFRATAASTITVSLDVPITGIVNPSFELDDPSGLTEVNNNGLRGYTLTNPTGWTVSGTSVTELLINANCYTDNNFGLVTTIPNGSYAYYMRQGWATGTTYVKQTITLPAAIYKLSVDQRTAYANSAASTLTIYAGTESKDISFVAGTEGCMPSRTWTTSSLYFELTEETTLELGFKITWQSGGSCVMLDNVTLEEVNEMPADMSEYDEDDISSTTEGIITGNFVPEATMMNDLLQMLADFSPYLVNDFNSVDNTYGYFNGESSGQSNEAGVRTNADLSMICAFLVKYAQPAGITLPNSISYSTLQTMAQKSLMWALGTHKANKLRQTTNSAYWGSTGTSDAVWESSLWAMSVAYSAFFQWDNLTSTQKGYLEALLKAECNYELNRTIPTGYDGDTKSEENGWETNILASALGLYPNDALASQWFERLRDFAINCYSHYSDASNQTVIDPTYNNETVADLHIGSNLYTDYTLQNHNLFHTSYQNVVMQELGESALALKLFQGNSETWKTNALMHNNQEVMDSVLNWLALTDGELAMPNGNDWSLFLYDQITSYTTQACFNRDPNALMLENLAYKFIKARQKTTTDGSWLLRPDVGARRMGVEAHRVMMTYLMHLVYSTADLTPTSWDDFRAARSEAKLFETQNVVRAFTKDRFTTFSWSKGLSSYTGYIASNSVDKNKIIVPYRANNTGNFLGWYTVDGQSTNATPVVSGIYDLKGDGYTMNGEIYTNGSTLDNRFVIYSTPGNAVMYLDYVQGRASGTITGEYGGLMAISVDELTKTTRTLYCDRGRYQSDGSELSTYKTNWLNIDNEVGFVSRSDKKMGFGNKAANNSIYTAKLYPSYSTDSRSFTNGQVVDKRNITYYSLIDAETTAQMEEELQVLTDSVPTGWNGAIAADPDGTNYLLLANFTGANASASLSNITCKLGAPVFEVETTIADNKSAATFSAKENHSVANVLKVFLTGSNISAQQDPTSDEAAYVTATTNTSTTVNIIADGTLLTRTISLPANETIRVYAENGEIKYETKDIPAQQSNDGYIVNPNFDGNSIDGWSQTGTEVAVDYNEVERWNANFDFYQTIYNLPAGKYTLTCQGFYRDGSVENASNGHKADTETIRAYLYTKLGDHNAVDAEVQPLRSIIDEAGNLSNVGVNAGNDFGYIPNTMQQASLYFAAGLYQVSLEVEVGDAGVLTIGVRNQNHIDNDWTLFDTFRLTRQVEVTHDVNKDGDITIDDVVAIVKHLLGKTPTEFDATAADVNNSEGINLADVTALVNIILNP